LDVSDSAAVKEEEPSEMRRLGREEETRSERGRWGVYELGVDGIEEPFDCPTISFHRRVDSLSNRKNERKRRSISSREERRRGEDELN